MAVGRGVLAPGGLSPTGQPIPNGERTVRGPTGGVALPVPVATGPAGLKVHGAQRHRGRPGLAVPLRLQPPVLFPRRYRARQPSAPRTASKSLKPRPSPSTAHPRALKPPGPPPQIPLAPSWRLRLPWDSQPLCEKRRLPLVVVASGLLHSLPLSSLFPSSLVCLGFGFGPVHSFVGP